MFTNAQKRNWTLFLWGLCDFLQWLPLQSSEEEIQAILWHPLGLLKLMKRPLLHPIHCCWRRNNIIVRPTDQNISRLITYILLCRVTASLSSTAPLWNCHTTSAISLNIFIQTKFHYNMPICQVLLNNKISAVYAETNWNIQPPLKKNCIYTRHGRINWKLNVWKTNIQKAWHWQNYLLPKNKKNSQNYQNVWYLRKMQGALT